MKPIQKPELSPAEVSKRLQSLALKDTDLEAPRASFNCGTPGIAFFLAEQVRLEGPKSKAGALRAAITIARRFGHAVKNERIAFNFKLEHGAPEVFPTESLASGVLTGHAGMGYVELLVSHQSRDASLKVKGLNRIADAYQRHERIGKPPAELYMGTAGYLAMVTDLASRGISEDVLAHITEQAAKRLLERYRMNPKTEFLGCAHGTTGELLGLLLVAERIPAKTLRKRLDDFLKLATVEGDFIAWPMRTGDPVPSSMWSTYCNGVVGQALLYLKAAQVFGDARYLDVGRRAAVTCQALPSGNASLCCGAAGAAVALAYAGVILKEPIWSRRAKARLDLAVQTQTSEPTKFLSGNPGIAWLQMLRAKREPMHMPFLRAL
jgi:eukaryotic-like serine/threonine-protein kinase